MNCDSFLTSRTALIQLPLWSCQCFALVAVLLVSPPPRSSSSLLLTHRADLALDLAAMRDATDLKEAERIYVQVSVHAIPKHTERERERERMESDGDLCSCRLDPIKPV